MNPREHGKRSIDNETRSALKRQRPAVIWLTGLSGAGKSTIANALELALFEQKKHTFLLDGDDLRLGLCRNLGFTGIDSIYETPAQPNITIDILSEEPDLVVKRIISYLETNGLYPDISDDLLNITHLSRRALNGDYDFDLPPPKTLNFLLESHDFMSVGRVSIGQEG